MVSGCFMRRLFCCLSGLSLVLFIFLLSPDVYAVKGFTTELMKPHTSRMYGRSSKTKTGASDDTKGSEETKPDDKKPNDDTDGGNAQSKLAAPIDDGEEGEITTLTVTPATNPVTGSPAQIPNLTPVENHILNHLASPAPLVVQQQDDQGHITLGGTLALWLSDFLSGNQNPVESLNDNWGRLYIPEFFGTTLAAYVNSLPSPEAGTGTLIWINITIPAGGAALAINHQMTIHFFTNIDDQIHMNLFMGHVNAITGQAVIATAIFSDEIDTSDRRENQKRQRVVRVDSLTNTDVVIDTQGMNPGSSRPKSSGGGMPPIKEGSGDSPQDRSIMMVGFDVLNKTIAEELKKQYETKMPFDENDWALGLDDYHETHEIME